MRKLYQLLIIILFLNIVLHYSILAQTPIRIVCVGNSITEGVGSSNEATKAYPVQLGNLLGSKYTVLNCGVSGRTMLKKGDYPYWNEQKFTDAKNFNADIVIIALGTNDSKSWNWVHKSEYFSDYIAMISAFRQDGKNPLIFVCFPPPAYIENFSIRDSIIRDQMLPLIDSVRRTSGTSLIDYYHPLLTAGDYFPDGIHPNDKGALLMAQIAYNTIRKSLSVTSLVSPVSKYSLTNSEPVTVTIMNNNVSALTHVPVAYKIDNNPEVKDTIDSIPAKRVVNFTFSQRVDLSENKEYLISFYTSVDTMQRNDTIKAKVSNFKPHSDLALVFSGNDGKVRIKHSASLMPTDSLTVEAWVYPTVFRSSISKGTVVSKEQGTPSKGYALNIGGKGQGRFAIYNTTVKEAIAPVGTFTLNTWYHIAGVYDGTSIKFYVNGILKATKSVTTISASTGELRIGQIAIDNLGNNNDHSFIGGIDEVSIWNKALTVTEIIDNKDYSLKGNEAGLVAYYKFNDGFGSRIISDSTGSGSTGKIQNMQRDNCWMVGVGLKPKPDVSVVHKINKSSDFYVFPNPASDFITIKLSEKDIQSRIVITDIMGKIVFSQDIRDAVKEQKIDVRKLAKGAYTLTLSSASELSTMMIIIK